MICEEHTTSGNIIVFSTSELLDECDATTEIFTMKMSRNTLELCIYSWPEFVHVFQPFNRDNLFITFHAHCYLQYIHHCSDTCCNMDASQIGYPVGTIITNLQYSLAWYHTILIHKLLQNYPKWFAQHLEYLQNGEPHTQNHCLSMFTLLDPNSCLRVLGVFFLAMFIALESNLSKKMILD